MRDLDIVFFDDERLPLYQRVLDRLGAILLDADAILEILRSGEGTSLGWMVPPVRKVYDDVHRVMTRLCD